MQPPLAGGRADLGGHANPVGDGDGRPRPGALGGLAIDRLSASTGCISDPTGHRTCTLSRGAGGCRCPCVGSVAYGCRCSGPCVVER
ncbi:hypothetical protein [Aeromonas sp. S16(2024)]|uniref:hypothetical protein n=1 Tax=Aeromonas sp. S16(2024) TaxID=3242889 RepID=UPI00352903DC